ncbi:MAG: 2-oxoacid:acceptor oxidoreductase subunit alpha [Saprospiraceae bacterium]|nr:2-oxoacid:acceptor oxidoreductase subunit alpha [Saprospiraceae bacterium]MCB9320257.1 2-oxoacid:acceptor oxidoreductase subunit alpha [Lewinellaceae bacterium]
MSDASSRVNDFVIRFANVNGTGSASANGLFAKAIYRMGIPVTPKNIFPSNIQGLPTWYEVRVSEKGYLGRSGIIDFVVAVNPQSLEEDIASVRPGGYILYDSSKPLHREMMRDDIHFLGIPMMTLAMKNFAQPREQQLLKNIIYVGALAALLDMDMDVLRGIVAQTFKSKEKLIGPNNLALSIGYNYSKENFKCPLDIRVETRDLIGDRILMEGNLASALGAIYGGASVMAWYPITPSTSVASAFEKYCKRLRKDPDTNQNRYAVIQAEDELAAIGMVIGASWNGARAFTATSGPGVSLMSEFIGLAYFAEVPAVIVNVQRGGPSTGMPTRTQQADLISSAYASHGDTKHIMLIPSTPTECFEMTAEALDLADRFQTVIFVMSDLDLGMNDHLTPDLKWDDNRKYDRGKVLNAEDLENMEKFGRYLDVDGDGIPYRTLPGTHPTKGSFFTRGTSRDEYARYTEKGDAYVRNVDRLVKKWQTAKSWVPKPEHFGNENQHNLGIIFFGTTYYAALEAMDLLQEEEIGVDALRLKSFPFPEEVQSFIDNHEEIFVIEQNRDAQMRTLLINELNVSPAKLIPILHYDGMPIPATDICAKIVAHLSVNALRNDSL